MWHRYGSDTKGLQQWGRGSDEAQVGEEIGLLAVLILAAAGCGRIGNIFGGRSDTVTVRSPEEQERIDAQLPEVLTEDRDTIWDLFRNVDDPNTTLEVNRYIWNATLDVLDFLPIQGADPFSGVLIFGYGTPPGGSRPYRATVYVQDPALDARSLRVALATRSGPAPIATVRAIEDAILTRARQLRIAEEAL